MTLNREELVLGIDIGGTQLKMGMVDRRGTLIEQKSVSLIKTRGMADLDFIFESAEELVGRYSENYSVLGIGISTPGILDEDGETVRNAVNLGWYDLPLKKLMEDKLKYPVFMLNDAAAGALGEYFFGSAERENRVLYVSIGTGIGACLLSNGTTCSILDLGHVSVDREGEACECGNKGCLEKYVSGPALSRRVRSERMNVEHSLLNVTLEGVSEQKAQDARLVYEAAVQGDVYARQVLREAGHILGTALVNCLHLFEFDFVVIGGGLSRAGSYLTDSVRDTVRERYKQARPENLRILHAKHPTHAGILGASAVAFNRLTTTQS